ncbi:hypothetical protein [Sulfurirhabdus autotrophica]|uniref:Uncharacterized protein n=1 Tax=Sulfurirhabdus autotrophica TaxID=1706046 RepID=A0A4R3Y6I3_9PROT|nr:hypothetical protein [Sulfurirhabdus autotrophica]TCV85823.1 hypothetical protein EDC63_10831 [Sulfurirhabdus autotrophica]
MAYRIDNVSENTGIWCWKVKGINGKGVYGTLTTGLNGRGLYQVNMGIRHTLIIPERFHVPPDLPTGEASLLLGLALDQMGWGPEVNQEGEIA